MTRERFNNIILINSRRMYAIALRIVGDRQEAEDIVQDVFLKMWTMGSKLDEYKEPEALAVTMVKNKGIDAVRKRKFIESEESQTQLSGGLENSPHDELVSAETREIVQKIIATLPEAFRIMLMMREIDGLSYEEISQATGANINSIRVTVSRARQMIKAEYIKLSYERGIVERTVGKIL
jgi:RNA polymerase sigma factor (sigma-70 family)